MVQAKLVILYISIWAVVAALPPFRIGALGAPSSDSGVPLVGNHTKSTCDKDPKEVLAEFLRQTKPDLRHFKIQGWRWHTMSLIREAKRLEQALSLDRVGHNTSNPYEAVIEYIVDFNMRGLHKIQDELFFPWVRKQIVDMAPPTISIAFGEVMDQLEKKQKRLESLGQELKSVSSRGHIDNSTARTTAEKFVVTGQSMLDTEDALLVPLVAHFVPMAQQTSFNNKVIRSLGIWDSRLHLVGMHEAVHSSSDKSERLTFEKEIPYLPRVMIPRWKRILYDPKVAVLVESESS